jgi:hypothetical protein
MLKSSHFVLVVKENFFVEIVLKKWYKDAASGVGFPIREVTLIWYFSISAFSQEVRKIS